MNLNKDAIQEMYERLVNTFLWENSPQGENYWSDVLDSIIEVGESNGIDFDDSKTVSTLLVPWPPELGTSAEIRIHLSYAFSWSESPQGHKYWMDVCNNLHALGKFEIDEHQPVVKNDCVSDYDRAMGVI